MKEYINYLKRNNYSSNTITTYRNILKIYIDLNDIRSIKRKLLTYSNSPNTIWTHYNVVLSYFKWNRDKRVESLKSLKLPQIPQVYREVFSKNFLLKRTEDLSNYKNVVVRFLFETGIRASELQNIVSFNNETLIVKGKGNKIREIFHNINTTKLLEEVSFTTKTLRLWVKDVLGDKYTPHSIRRSHATHMLMSGANPKVVMMQLGHSKVETTYKYLNISIKQNKAIYNKYF